MTFANNQHNPGRVNFPDLPDEEMTVLNIPRDEWSSTDENGKSLQDGLSAEVWCVSCRGNYGFSTEFHGLTSRIVVGV